MNGYDVQGFLSEYDERQRETQGKTLKENLNNAASKNKSDAIISKKNAEKAAVNQEARDEAAESVKESREVELGTGQFDTKYQDVQKQLASQLLNATLMKNSVSMIRRMNQERGMNKEIGMSRSGNSARVVSKNQVSTIAIPTQLLRYVQGEIGQLSTRATQNEIMAGFLYWYFGQPEDVAFESRETLERIFEIAENLDIHASPAKLNRMSYNASNSLVDKLETLENQINIVSTLMTAAAKDSVDEKVRLDKIYIAICYNVLNMLAFAPPIMPGESPSDVDFLSNGMVWDMMSGVDTAYEYFRTKNGRELYKDQVRRKTRASIYTPPVQTVSSDDAQPESDSYEPDDGYYNYEDEPEYTDLEIDYDDTEDMMNGVYGDANAELEQGHESTQDMIARGKQVQENMKKLRISKSKS